MSNFLVVPLLNRRPSHLPAHGKQKKKIMLGFPEESESLKVITDS
jgi:hypothetical protein